MATLDDEPRQVQYITKDELDKQIMRLTQRPAPAAPQDTYPKSASKTLTKEEMEKMKERLYTQSIQRKEATLKEMEEQAQAQQKPAAKMSSDEMGAMVERLYTESLAKKKANMEESKKQYLFHPDEPKKIPLKTFVERMYDEGLEKEKEKQKKLHDKYLAPTEIHTSTISKSQAAESAARLSSTAK